MLNSDLDISELELGKCQKMKQTSKPSEVSWNEGKGQHHSFLLST